jgi:hypothetical protein
MKSGVGLGADAHPGLHPGYDRIDPDTRSKRNRRHSIGPFHIGTRRLSFKRIALGSFMSGLNT